MARVRAGVLERCQQLAGDLGCTLPEDCLAPGVPIGRAAGLRGGSATTMADGRSYEVDRPEVRPRHGHPLDLAERL